MNWTRVLCGAVMGVVSGMGAWSNAQVEHVWLESEATTRAPEAARATPWNGANILSGGRALVLSAERNEVARVIPEDGAIIAYEFDAPSAGEYQGWNRVAMENVRAPFAWRVNEGAWQTNTPKDNPSIDVIEAAFWNPMGWSKMGEVSLRQGRNTLEIRVDRVTEQRNNQAELAAVRYISDAICFTKGEFFPNHHHKPGDAWMTEKDRAAAQQVFKLERGEDGKRAQVSLNGTWQYAAWDEKGEITEENRRRGVEALPEMSALHWRAFEVPGDRNEQLRDFTFNHRYILRTRVEVPAEMAGSALVLDLREINMIATLFVNGQKAGESDVVLGFWQPEISRFVKPGEVNEIAVVIKDTFYAMRPNAEGSVRLHNYIPMSLVAQNQGVTNRFDFPVKGANETGILEGASLIATGPAYVEDVFVKTDVKDKEVAADVTVKNTTGAAMDVEVLARVEPAGGGAAVLTLSKQTLNVSAGEVAEVTAKANVGDELKLWWQDDPQLYHLVTEVRGGGKLLDTQVTRFGYRQWEIKGNQFYLNGIRQQLRADLTHYGASPRVDLKQVRARWEELGTTMFRLRFQYDWAGMRYGKTLAWMDEVGMPVRLHAGSFDGQHASYGFGDKANPNAALFENWHKQVLNRARTWRNHPSVFIWELDNEIVYINGRNLGKLDVVEPAFTKAKELLAELDPTRSVVIGGGNALRDKSLPTYGVHYFEVNDRFYPEEAYTIERSLAAQNSGDNWHPWPMDFEDRPTFMSETAFLPGRSPAGFAAVGGETTFLGKTEAQPAAARIARWLTEGYRWKGVAAFHYWFDDRFTGDGHWLSFQPVAVFCREWNWTFGSEQEIERTLKAFNETRFSDPVEVEWQFTVGDRQVAGERKTMEIPAGDAEEFKVSFKVPQVSERTAAGFTLVARHRGKEVFRETKPVWLIDPAAGPKASVNDLLVWDPKGAVSKRLRDRGIEFKTVRALAEIPDRFGLLLVGPDAIGSRDATDSRWLVLAAAGNKMMVLEQEHPLHYQAVAADFDVTDFEGRIAFPQDLSHPILAGLDEPDFVTWSGDGVVYKRAYKKATTGARSLVQCDNELSYSAMSISTVNEGLMLLSQLVIGAKIESDPVAQRLFDNMLAWAADYKLVQKHTAVTADFDAPTGRMLAGMGMSYEAADDPVAAIREGKAGVIVVQATPQNMSRLAAELPLVRKYLEDGGWMMVMGVNEQSLADFNKLVGYEHLIRPFRMEKVTFAPTRDPLTAGLSLSDLVMSSGERIQVHNRDEWPVDDAFVGIVDIDDIAPFAKFPDPAYWNDPETKGPGTDTWPLNMVNGYLADTHWRMIFSIHLNNGDPTKWEIELPREEEIIGFSIAPNRIYHDITRIRLTFDGGNPQEFDLEGESRQDLVVSPVKAKKIGIELLAWNPKGTSDVIGVDNLWVRVKRPAGFEQRVRPMLNIGGLVRYNIGKGGIVLNQYNVIANEKNPANAQKKATVTATLLRNLGSSFTGGRTIVAGQNLSYQPVSLDGIANLYLKSEQGFPIKENDLSQLPVGTRRFAGVEYEIRDFATSPLESAVMLQNRRYKVQAEKPEVKGIAVNRKADALFFLHTLLPGDRWNPRRGAEEPPIIFQYTVNYDDGTSAVIPVELGVGVANWLQTEPKSLRAASVAWSTKARRGDNEVTVYQMQWTNPRPEKTIKSIDLTYGPEKEKWGAPVLLGITAAQVQQ